MVRHAHHYFIKHIEFIVLNGNQRVIPLQTTTQQLRRTIPKTYLVHWLLTSSTANTDTIYNISLFSLVTKSASLVWSAWLRQTSNARELSVFPAADTLKKTEHIALLLLPELFNVLQNIQILVRWMNQGCVCTDNGDSSSSHTLMQLKIACDGDYRDTYFIGTHIYLYLMIICGWIGGE